MAEDVVDGETDDTGLFGLFRRWRVVVVETVGALKYNRNYSYIYNAIYFSVSYIRVHIENRHDMKLSTNFGCLSPSNVNMYI